jgi:phospholipid/cholesterol/gamma-HCH transport system substrate-binding protein
MPPYKRNIMVGLTVLLSLTIFGWMAVKFSSQTAELFSAPQMIVKFQAPRVDGLFEGSPVYYLGVTVGRVTTLQRLPDDNGVMVSATIDVNPPIPSNVTAVIRKGGLIGGNGDVSLEAEHPVSTTPLLPGALIMSEVGGSDLIPPELTATATEIGKFSRQLRESNVTVDMDQAIKTLNTQLIQAGQLIQSVNKLLADEKMQADLKASIANIRQTTDNTTRLSASLNQFSSDTLPKIASDADAAVVHTDAHIDAISRQLTDRLGQVAKLLTTFQSISQKIDTGSGSGAMLVNDPRLYTSLVDTARQLDATVGDLKRLVEQWEQEGVTLKLH